MNLIVNVSKNLNMNSFLSKTDLEVIALAIEIYELNIKKLDLD